MQVTISPRSFSASRTAATSNSRCNVDLTPISMLSKSMNTASLSLSSIYFLLRRSTLELPGVNRVSRHATRAALECRFCGSRARPPGKQDRVSRAGSLKTVFPKADVYADPPARRMLRIDRVAAGPVTGRTASSCRIRSRGPALDPAQWSGGIPAAAVRRWCRVRLFRSGAQTRMARAGRGVRGRLRDLGFRRRRECWPGRFAPGDGRADGCRPGTGVALPAPPAAARNRSVLLRERQIGRAEEHTSELQSLRHLV